MESAKAPVFPRFVPVNKSPFFQTLQKRVNQHFKDNNISRHANSTMVIKTVVMISAFVFPIVIINTIHLKPLALMAMYFIAGLAVAGIGMSVMHDANHGAYSKKTWVNQWLGYSLNMVGGMVFNWKIQHNVLHHTYTNIHECDDDIGGKLLIRLDPHSESRRIYRFQWIYALLVYSIMTLFWALAKDFIQFFGYRKKGLHRFKGSKGLQVFLTMLFWKAAFFAYTFVIPVYVMGYSVGLVIGGMLVMFFVSGLVLAVVFQLAHVVEEADFPLPNERNEIETDWAIHQMRTTMNFARNNKLLSWYVGGLNYQVEHHLFPNICHVHYPAVSKIVEETAAEFGVPYLCSPTFSQAFRSHMGLIKKLGYVPELDLARM